MSLITGSGLGKYFGAQDVFRSVSFAAARGAKVGLVGPNGTGKTTLLRIMAGLEQATEGEVHRASGTTIGYLPQDSRLEGEGTLWQGTIDALSELRRLEAEVRELEERLAGDDSPALWRRYEDCQHRFEAMGGYEYEWRARQALEGLGLGDAVDLPVSKLSGGQHTRAHLARLLLQRPDLLLLDEPTNHLDLQALTWLESFLQGWEGTLIVISHDRYFLDAVANEIWDLGSAGLDRYRGNYSAYEQQKADRLESLRRQYEAQQEYIKTTEAFFRRYKAGQRSREAFGRMKRLGHIERMELPPDARPMRLRLKASSRSGWVVVEAHDAVIGYSGKPLFRITDLQLLRGERAAIIGANGSGKTTFVRTVLGEMPPLAGKVMIGHSVSTGYLSQAQHELQPERTLIDELNSVREVPMAEARNHLALFLFTGDDVFKRIAQLSGGERSRVALAKLTLQGANLLVLDEPTNQLDIVSRDVLETVLSEYDGTILFVSHDRYFIDALATQVWAIDGGGLKTYLGNYTAYAAARAAAAAAGPAGSNGEDAERRRQTPRSSPEARASQREEKRRQERRDALEAEIASLEARVGELEASLAVASERGEVQVVTDLGAEHRRANEALAAAYREWGEVA